MVTSSDFQKFGGDLDIVVRVFDNLDASLPGIILRPRVTVELVSLITRMTNL